MACCVIKKQVILVGHLRAFIHFLQFSSVL
jgi:hypothetical protein